MSGELADIVKKVGPAAGLCRFRRHPLVPVPQGLTAIVIEADGKDGQARAPGHRRRWGLERNAHLTTYTSLWERRMTGCSLG